MALRGRLSKRAGIIVGAILLLLVIGLFAWLHREGTGDEPSNAETTVLRVGSQKGGAKSAMIAAGVLEGVPYRIEWSEFPAAQHLLEALSSEAIDLGTVGDAPFLFAYQAGGPIVAVQAARAEDIAGSSAILVAKNSPIKSARDLKGKRIVTGRGSAGHYLLLRALASVGLKASDATIIFLAPSDANAGDVGDEELGGRFGIDADGNIALALRVADAAGDGCAQPSA